MTDVSPSVTPLTYCEVDLEWLLHCHQFRLVAYYYPRHSSFQLHTVDDSATRSSYVTNIESSRSTINFQHLRYLDVYGVLLVRYHVSFGLLISDLSVAGGAMYEVLWHHSVAEAAVINHSLRQRRAVARPSNVLSGWFTHPDIIVTHLRVPLTLYDQGFRLSSSYIRWVRCLLLQLTARSGSTELSSNPNVPT